MRKFCITIALLGAFLLSMMLIHTAMADEVFQLTCTADVYETHSLDSRKIATAKEGQLYIITDSTERNRWIKVYYQDKQTNATVEGWIKEDMLASQSLLTNPPVHTHDDDTGAAVQRDIGFVLCETISLRESANPASNKITSIVYGTTFVILQEDAGWYHLVYEGQERYVSGWVDARYVLKNPEYYTTRGETPVYAYNSSDALRIGLLDAEVSLPILYETNTYYIVSLRTACGFILK